MASSAPPSLDSLAMNLMANAQNSDRTVTESLQRLLEMMKAYMDKYQAPDEGEDVTETVVPIMMAVAQIITHADNTNMSISAMKSAEFTSSMIKSSGIETCKNFILHLKDNEQHGFPLIQWRLSLYAMLGWWSMFSKPYLQIEIVKHGIPAIIAGDLTSYYLNWNVVYERIPEPKSYNIIDTTGPMGALSLLENCANVPACRGPLKEQILEMLNFYVDATDNDIHITILAISLIHVLNPQNEIHSFLFTNDLFTKLAELIKNAEYVPILSYLIMMKDEAIPLVGAAPMMSLSSLLNCFLALVRSEDYKCQVIHAFCGCPNKLDEILTQGTNLETERLKNLLQALCRHACNICDVQFIQALLSKHGVIVESPQPPLDSADSAHAATSEEIQRIIPVCRYMDLCYRFLKQLDEYDMKISFLDQCLDSKYHRCFCGECIETRGDDLVYERGEPAKQYATPHGWAKFALKVPPRTGHLKVFDKWHVGFHGTDADKLTSILKTGELLMTGDVMPSGARLRPPSDHYDEENAPSGHDIKRVFVSPSIAYAGLPKYAREKIFTIPPSQKEFLGKVAFQVRIKPDSYEEIAETVGLDYQLDPNFSNDTLEWATDRRGVVILVGILVRVDHKVD